MPSFLTNLHVMVQISSRVPTLKILYNQILQNQLTVDHDINIQVHIAKYVDTELKKLIGSDILKMTLIQYTKYQYH